jgi:hypothetical protein
VVQPPPNAKANPRNIAAGLALLLVLTKGLKKKTGKTEQKTSKTTTTMAT